MKSKTYSPSRRALRLLQRNRRLSRGGICAVCSAHPMVLRTALRAAREQNALIGIESTSNQVNQFGGYAGMRPSDFAVCMRGLALQEGMDAGALLLGGDHLGPNPWRNLPAAQAMDHARTLVQSCVQAGYRKIHLDASMPLADDAVDQQGRLQEKIVANRTADLCRVAEKAWEAEFDGSSQLIYVIGAEVPAPGGALEGSHKMRPTTANAVAQTLEVAEAAFRQLDLDAAWERVCAVVVQPGVEFGDDFVCDYSCAEAMPLLAFIAGRDRLVYEAHSTDYQCRKLLCDMAQDHFAILKVGPALTFAYREALFLLEAIEQEIVPAGAVRSDLAATLEQVMLADPQHWRHHYRGSAEAQAFARKYSRSDRSRYYWTHPDLAAACERLIANLRTRQIPWTLLSQYMPAQYRAVREAGLALDPAALIDFHIRYTCLDDYLFACRP